MASFYNIEYIMGFFENIGANNPVSRTLAEIVRTISSDHRIESDLDLYVTAINNISRTDGLDIRDKVIFPAPFIVIPDAGGPIRIALFNELHPNASSASSTAIVKQYEEEIALYFKESHDMLSDKQIIGYFAAIITESRTTESSSYYPRGGKFEYYYRAEPDGRSFRIIGETLAGL